MADVHGLNDLRNTNSNSNRNYRAMGGNAQGSNGTMGTFMNIRTTGDPRKETFWSFLKNFMCPQLKLFSFTCAIIFILVAIYIVTLCWGIEDPKSFLSPKISILQYGTLSNSKLRGNPIQAYRWVSNSLLHANFIHILSNCFALLIFGTLTEKLLSTFKYSVIYIGSGIIGSLFSALCALSDQNSDSVGASICVYGVFGGYFAFCLLNWNRMTELFGPMGKCLMFYMLFFFIVITTLFQIRTNVNVYGHIGGLIFGFMITCVICPPDNENQTAICQYKYWRYISAGILTVFTLGGFLFFYLY